ncbi:MAG: HAD family hydrolase [Pirellulaceae bacterium]|nr:HAD family hydrolase [Pirellulaceae bacterium]
MSPQHGGRFQAVMFDLDGTLLDTLEDLAAASNDVLRDMGLPTHDMDAYRYLVGDGVNVLFTRAVPEAVRSDELVRQCVARFLAVYDRQWNVRSRPYPGIMELLADLTVRDVPLAVLSNKPHEFTERCVREYFPGVPFQAVIGQREHRPRKPDPAAALEIAELLGVAPSEWLYLGDTATDMRTAVAAGMFPVGALWGFRPADELRESGALALLHSPRELLTLLP